MKKKLKIEKLEKEVKRLKKEVNELRVFKVLASPMLSAEEAQHILYPTQQERDTNVFMNIILRS